MASTDLQIPSEAAPLFKLLTQVSERMDRVEQYLVELRQLLDSGSRAKEWLRTSEFADEVGRAEFTIRCACNKKRLIDEKTGNGREWRIHRDELERYRRQGLLSA